jgi:hypothetical protein
MRAMSDILKSWLANLPNSEMKEMECSLPNESGSGRSVAGQSHLPSVDDPPQEWKESLPLEISNDMRLFLSPEYIQVDSPQRLDESFLRMFSMGYKKVLLLNPQNGEIASGSLSDLQTGCLIADVANSTVLQECGKSLLVVFPFLPKRQFVVQAIVDEINGNKIKLRYQDPRYGMRWKLPPCREVSLHIATAEMTAIIIRQQAQTMRELSLSCDRAAGCQKLHIADISCVTASSTHRNAARCFDGEPSFVCSLENISLGGACLSSNAVSNRDELLHQFIRLNIPLPPLMLDNASLQLRLQPLAVVHGVGASIPSCRINVQFLKQLPQELTVFFERLSATN